MTCPGAWAATTYESRVAALPPHNPLPWVLLIDPYLQRGIGDLRVHLGRRDAAVAEEALDVADVDAFFEEVGGDGVAEHVGGDAVADFAAFAVEADEAADHLRAGGFAAGVDEEGVGAGGGAVAGGAVIAEEGLDVVGDEDAALAVAFADDGDRAVVDVDRCVEEAGQFADAHAGGEEELGGDVGGEVGEGGR